MALFQTVSLFWIKLISKILVRSKYFPEKPLEKLGIDPYKPIIYITRTNSYFDLIAISRVCQQVGLAAPEQDEVISGNPIPRYLAVTNPPPIFHKNTNPALALSQAQQIFSLLQRYPDTEIQIVPVTVLWGRNPGKEQPSLTSSMTHSYSPGWLRKFVLVLFSGRNSLVKFSPKLDLAALTNKKTPLDQLPSKLIRVARVHFKRQQLSATGPKSQNQQSLIDHLINSESLQRAIMSHAEKEHISVEKARSQATAMLNELAANYSGSVIRIGDKLLAWLWNRIYQGIEVKHKSRVLNATQKGHAIVYMPCHRSHMDYLLLTYVIHNMGLSTPHIAAGINLNFWPAGPIFRRGGAFFIRRTFKGNRLYSQVVQAYLTHLFVKGFPVKFYTEGGRSRTGRLLAPKTGMLAMTVQTLAQGVQRPVSIVPIYIGYENVMEVNTYLGELQGAKKKGESLLGTLKALKNLKNYGKGFVNFGEPIQLNQFLNQQSAEFANSFDTADKSIGSSVNQLAHQVMVNINKTSALNAMNLVATILLTSDQLALPRKELLFQLQLLIELQLNAPYHRDVTLINQHPEQLLKHALQLGKLEVHADSFGDIIRIKDSESVTLHYYKNNIIHLFAFPGIVAAYILNAESPNKDTLLASIQQLKPLLEREWFMDVDNSRDYIEKILAVLVNNKKLIINPKGDLSVVDVDAKFHLELLSNTVQSTALRYAVVTGLIKANPGISGADLEQSSQEMASRLSRLHGVNAPEFYDSKVHKELISTLYSAELDLNHSALAGTIHQVLPQEIRYSLSKVLS